MINRYIRMLGCSTAVLVAAPAMAQTATQAPATVPQSLKDSGTAVGVQSDDARDEIIVTASKREERLQDRSEEHTSELQSLMRSSYAVFCLKKKQTKQERKAHQKT